MSREETRTDDGDRTALSSPRQVESVVLAALGVMVITVIVWWGSLKGPFHYDDQRTVQYNPEIRSLSNVGEFLRNFHHRGLLKIGYALNYRFGGKERDGTPTARSFHAVNLGLHALNAGLALGLVWMVLNRSPVGPIRRHQVPVASAVALLFALHPIHGMAVNLIASRAVLQAGVFSLLGLILLVPAVTGSTVRGKRVLLLVGAGLMFLCGLGSKSVAIATVGFGAVLSWMLLPPVLSPRARRTFLGVALLAVIGVVAVAVAFGREVWQASYHGPWVNLLTQGTVIIRYVGLLLWPGPLSIEHDVPLVASVLDVRAVLSGFVLIGLLVVGLALLWKRRLPGLAIVWFFVALAPTSSILPRVEPMVEYRTYLAVLGFAGAVMWFVCRFVPLRAARLALLCAVLIGALGVRTVTRHRVYADPVALWTDAAEKTPNRARPAFNLGTSLALVGKHAAALPHLRRAAALQPDNPEIHFHLGLTHQAMEQADRAIRAYRRAHELLAGSPAVDDETSDELSMKLASAQLQLADKLALSGRYEDALDPYRGAVQCRASPARAHYNLGEVLVSLGRVGEAAQTWRRGVERFPNDHEMCLTLAWLLATCPDGDVRDGAEALRLAGRVVSTTNRPSAHQLDVLSAAQAEAGQFDQAVETAKRAIRTAQAQDKVQPIEDLRARLRAYQSGRAWREKPQS